MKEVEVKVGNLIKLNDEIDDDNIWIVLKVKHFFKSDDKVNAVRIRSLTNKLSHLTGHHSKEIWHPARKIKVIA